MTGCGAPCRAAAALDTALARDLRAHTLRAMDHAYNFDFPSADRAFDEAMAIEPLHPAPWLGKAGITFWGLILDRSDSSYRKFLSQAEEVIDRADQYIDKYGKDAEVLTCLGTVYGYRAFAHGRMKNYFKAAWDGKKSHDYFNEALELDKQWYDAYAGLGVFHYFASFMPKALQWIVGVLGVEGDAPRGIRELEMAANKGVYHRVEAKFFLAELLPWHSENFDSSEAILKDLAAAYPHNSIFSFTLAIWQLRRNDPAAARDNLQKIEPPGAVTLQGLRPFVEYKLGECDFRLLNYARAKEDYMRFLTMYNEEAYTATANYRIGVCSEFAGNRDAALSYYRVAAKSSRKFGDDAYAARRSEKLLSTPLSHPDSMLLGAQGLFKSGRYEKAQAAFTALKSMPGISHSVLAEAIYNLGETFSERHAYREALENFQVVAAMKLEPIDVWMAPWSHYQSGLCHKKLNEQNMAKAEFEKVLDFNDYDFQNWISYRSKRELEDLNK